MKSIGGYKLVHVSPSISKKKLSKAAKGGTIMLSADDLRGNKPMLVHPENAKKITSAQKSGKGARLNFAQGEIQHDLGHHQGASLWDSIKSGLSSLWNVVGKPIASAALDGIANAAQTAGDALIPGVNIGSTLAPALRNGVRNLTGVGLKGSQAAKDRMALVRSKRRAGSFKLN